MLWMQGFGNLAVQLREEYGWSKTLFSSAFSATRTGSALIGPAVAAAIARFGTKRIMRTGSVFVFVGYLALSLVETKLHFFIAMGIGAFGVTLAGFLAITSALVQWFERKRAQALSMQTVGFAIGGFCGPLLVVGFNQWGWRPTLVGAGAILAIAGWFAAGLIGTDRADSTEPTDGIAPDDVRTAARKAEGVNEVHFTVRQAVRTRAFWMVSAGHGSALLAVSTVIAHIAGLLLLAWIDSTVAIAAFVILHGLAWGARGPQMQAIRADYFGATNFAGILGWSSIIIMLGMVTGPLIAGYFADSTGDYRLGFTIVGLMTFAGNGFWALASPPRLPAESALT